MASHGFWRRSLLWPSALRRRVGSGAACTTSLSLAGAQGPVALGLLPRLVQPLARRFGRGVEPAESKLSYSAPQHVGIFVDVENLGHFLKNSGAEKLVETASEYGSPIVRKAFGNWANPGVSAHQARLVANGFQLVHTPHPVSGKNSADIAMVVDVMAMLHSMPNLSCYVLATGDSDFSHLFCHLRQSDRVVVGVGPCSVLSEIVKNTADKFVYTSDLVGDLDDGRLRAASATIVTVAMEGDTATGEIICDTVSEVDTIGLASVTNALLTRQNEANALLTRALQTVDWDETPDVNPSLLKFIMLRLDSSFDQRRLGFVKFQTFLIASGLVSLSDFDEHSSTRRVMPLDETVKNVRSRANKGVKTSEW